MRGPGPPPVRSPPVPRYAFDLDTAVEAVGPGRWRGMVTDGWDIGVVPNGGYVLCVALAAVGEAVSQPHPLTVTAHYLSPCAHGPVEIDVEVEKDGRTLSTASARLVQDGRTRLAVLATFGDLGRQNGPTRATLVPPSLPPLEECGFPGDRPLALGIPGRPTIVDRVDFRPTPTAVARIEGRDGDARLEGWIRLRDDRPLDAHALALLVDASPPAIFAAMETGWVPTLELTVHIRGLPRPGWLKASIATRALIDGLLEEDCLLWDVDDRLVAMSRQLARVLPAEGDPGGAPGHG
jgi:acyl-CoA thioesterase